jgi:hypothetical protein
MQTLIAAGECTRFDCAAELTIGKDGRLEKILMLSNSIACRHRMRCPTTP